MPYFNSLDPICRIPTGAVPTGTIVTFTLFCSPEESVDRCTLLLFADDRDPQPTHSLPMVQGENNSSDCRWQVCFPADQPALWFYQFETGAGRLRRQTDGSSGPAGGFWQLTVYDASYTTPDWWKGGIVYQVFPDRFCNSGQPKQQVPSERFLHANWSDLPNWWPDPQTGEIENNDWFGGDLAGIQEKLPYLADLGVSALYLNPIFESHSNHRYDTADYRAIDPLLGTEEDFTSLCQAAEYYGIRVILDGVFNHMGSDSRYFNAKGRYPELGAVQSQESPYYPWFRFTHWPDQYDSWWGIRTLPALYGEEPSLNAFLCGEDGVLRHWLCLGAAGWRLDVADELNDVTLDHIRQAVKAERPDSLLLGEVWEDASNKIAYGKRRRYFLGGQLDSVMDYPMMEAILRYIREGDGPQLLRVLGSLWENYPRPTLHCLMNSLSTHDTVRAITRLAGEPYTGQDRAWQAQRQILLRDDYLRGVVLFKLAAVLQYTLFGVPCLYYGDELGLTGYRDPFNRASMPWDSGDQLLLQFFRSLGQLRRTLSALREGDFQPLAAGEVFSFLRQGSEQTVFVAVNRSPETQFVSHPSQLTPLLGELQPDGTLPGMQFCIALVGQSSSQTEENGN